MKINDYPGATPIRKEFLTCKQASQSKEAKASYDDDDHDDDAGAMPAMCCFVLFCVVLFSELAMTIKMSLTSPRTLQLDGDGDAGAVDALEEAIKMSLTVCGSLLCDGDGDALERR